MTSSRWVSSKVSYHALSYAFTETTTSTKKFAHIPPATDLLPPSKTAAPSVKEYVPPPPAPTDPYPGYYQKPDGQWAAYEPEYYWSIAKVWQPVPSSSTDSARSRKRQWEGDEEDFRQVSALDEASRARAEIEQTKSITAEVIHAGPTAPNMKMTVRYLALIIVDVLMTLHQAARSSNVAKSRHQLSTLLTDAYTHRAEIEDKIAMVSSIRSQYLSRLITSPYARQRGIVKSPAINTVRIIMPPSLLTYHVTGF